MGKHHMKSASNILHNMLVQHPIGYEFDVNMLTEESQNYGYDFSTGAITGFITRALRKEIIVVKGKVRIKNTNHTKRVYSLVNKREWEFKPAGIGSYPGREVHGKASGDQPELPMIGMTITENGVMGHFEPKEEAPKSDHHADALIGLPVMHVDDHPIDVGPSLADIVINAHSKMCNDYKPIKPREKQILSDALMSIAHEVFHLENKPDKSLADYSTNDLIEELRKRIK